MAERKVYIGSAGPYLYDDEEEYSDGVLLRGFRGVANIDQDSDPTSPQEGDAWSRSGTPYMRLLGITRSLLTGGSGGSGVSVGDTLTGDVSATFASSSTTVTLVSDSLNALKALTPAADQLPYFNGSSGAALTTLTSFARTLLDDANAAAMRTTLGLVIGTNVQAYDADLTTWAGLTPSAYFQTLVDDVDAATARGTLLLGTIATQDASSVAITGGSVNNATIGASTPNTGAFTTLTTSGDVTVGGNTGARALAVNGAAGSVRDIRFQTAGSNRWVIRCESTAESGSNAGSALQLLARADDGSAIDNVITIIRAAGGGITVVRPTTFGANQLTCSNVSFTGGAIDGTTIGSTAKAAGGFTTLSSTGLFDIGGAGDHFMGAAAGSNTTVNIRAAADTVRFFRISTGNTRRWGWGGNTGAESGSDAGCPFNLTAYSDAGSFIDNVITIVRASGGAFTISRPLTVNAGINIPSGQTYKINNVQIGLSNGLSDASISGAAAGHLLVRNAGNTAFANVAMSGDATLASTGAITLANSGVTAGTYQSVTVDAKGRVTAGTVTGTGGFTTLSTNATSVDNSGTGETDLMSYSVPAGQLSANKDSISFEAILKIKSGKSCTMRAYFGSTKIFEAVPAAPIADTYYHVQGTIIRTGATAQMTITSNLNSLYGAIVYATPAETLSGAVTFKFTGQGGATSDMSQLWLRLWYNKTS